ncbi:hypothetical protein ACQ4PT_053779 [Festuca glaucescens]
MEEDPSRPFLVLGNIVQDLGYVNPSAFRIVECSSKAAYGCGPNGDAIVRGLELFVRLGGEDDPYSPTLCISAADEVFRLVGLEIDGCRVKVYGRFLRLYGHICTVDGDVMVVRVSFVAIFGPADFRKYYLVYDSAAASLSLLPSMPPCCRPVCTEVPLKVMAEGKYSLSLMAERSVSPSAKYTDPVLCLWSPPPPSPDDKRRDYSKRAWELKARVRVNAVIADELFLARVPFLLKGNAVWGYLAQGILYCDRNDLVDDGTEPVDFKHVMLPSECRATDDSADFDLHQSPAYRTMGCVRDCVWFVLIEPSFTFPGDTTVKVWTLDLLSVEEEKKWNLHKEFNMQRVWELEVFKAQGLPEAVPKFPFFRQQALYMLQPEPYTGGIAYARLVCIDLSSSCEVVSLLSNRLAMPLMERPVFVDPVFFDPHPLHTAIC